MTTLVYKHKLQGWTGLRCQETEDVPVRPMYDVRDVAESVSIGGTQTPSSFSIKKYFRPWA